MFIATLLCDPLMSALPIIETSQQPNELAPKMEVRCFCDFSAPTCFSVIRFSVFLFVRHCGVFFVRYPEFRFLSFVGISVLVDASFDFVVGFFGVTRLALFSFVLVWGLPRHNASFVCCQSRTV